MKKTVLKNLIWVAIIAVSILLDRVVKLWAVNSLKPIGDIPVINGVFHLTYATNTGGAWSILSGRITFFIIITVIALAAGIYFLFFFKKYDRILYYTSISLIIGGAVGNFIDRLMYGEVVDMFYIKLINFPVFNVADMILVAGTICLSWFILFQTGDGEKKNDSKQHDNAENNL